MHQVIKPSPLFATVETLLRLAKSSIDVNIQDKHGTSALHVAVMRREEKIVKLLLSAFAEVNIKDKDDKTPLHHAIYTSEIVERSFRGNQHTIVHLLLLHGANPNMRDVQGSTPLLYAASAGSVGDTLILHRQKLPRVDSAAHGGGLRASDSHRDLVSRGEEEGRERMKWTRGGRRERRG
eukprot:761540-Hanusia_phi.AAC.2